jgi:hypothetical protein
MKASLLIMTSTLLFALMGVCVKFASTLYGAGEIVMYRSVVGLLLMLVALRWRGLDWRTRVPAMHFWRSASGTAGLCLWFFAIGALPLATAMTLNYMSSVWMAVFLVASALLFKGRAGSAPSMFWTGAYWPPSWPALWAWCWCCSPRWRSASFGLVCWVCCRV